MIVQAKFAALKGIKPHEFALRFIFGGLVCVGAGLIAKKYGPEIGGLFLAFPAIFPAGASLVEAMKRSTRHALALTEPIADAWWRASTQPEPPLAASDWPGLL